MLNYATAIGFGTEPELFAARWPADLHVIGKDIARFHAVIWPALLMAAGEAVPRTVFVHGFLTIGGEKMSKSRGTGVHPFELLDIFGVDSYRYFFLRQFAFGNDGDYSLESITERHNADLANGLGNLAARVLAMLGSYFDGAVPAPELEGCEADLPAVTASAVANYDAHMLAVELQPAVAAVWSIVDRANGYLVEKEPWKLAKDPDARAELAACCTRVPSCCGSCRLDPAAHARRRSASVGAARPARRRPRPTGPRGSHLGPARARHPDPQGREPLPAPGHVATAQPGPSSPG